jgi:pimeloyl-ACP methyl ester carboxylesterase
MTAYHPFRSEAAKKEYLALYDIRVKKWPVDSKTKWVDTSHGQTFVRMSGPGGTVLPIRLEWIIRAVLCFLPHRYFTKIFLFWLLEDLAHKNEASRTILEEEVDAVVVRMRCYKPIRLIRPAVLEDAKLKRIKVPALYLVGEREKICSARKAIQRLHKVAPQIKTEVIPDAGHDVSFVQAEIVNAKVLEFLSSHDA